ncbi:alpha/beta hydrolase [Peribacillus frigoritolerans]
MSKLTILIPGIMGSNLVFGSYRVWPRYFPTNIGVYEKYLPIGKVKIDPAGLIDRVYSKMFNNLSTMENTVVLPFAYDWRNDNLITAKTLDTLIMKEHDKYQEINIVAHSMGGIISKLLLNKYSEQDYIPKIKKLITLGTPWHGSLDSYKTIVYGKSIPDSFPWNSIVLTKERSKDISKGFPSVYQLFPDQVYEEQLHSEYNLSILTKNDEEIDNMGFFQQDEIKTHMERFEFNYSTLIDEFRNTVNTQKENTNHIIHHEIIGFGTTTLTSLKKNKRDEVMGYFKNGDGTVPTFSAKSNGAQNRYFIKGAEHQELVGNIHSLNLVRNLLLDNIIQESNNVFLDENRVKSVGFKSKIIRIACPVEVSIVKDGKSIYGYGDSLGGDSLEEMQDANLNVVSLGNTVYVIFNADNESVEDEQIVIEAYDEGPTSISVEQYSNGEKEKSVTFKTFNINPSMLASINLKDEVEHTKLKIRDEEFDETIEEPIEITDGAILLPRTTVTINADSEYVTDDISIYAGEFKVKVNELSRGTYDVAETYIMINDVTFSLDPTVEYNLIELEEGYKKVKIFSVDILGNEEISEAFNVFYMNDFKPSYQIEILPHQYKISVDDNKNIAELIRKYNLPGSQVQFNSNEEENVYINNDSVTVLTQNPQHRQIEIGYRTFLGNNTELFTLDEYNILNLFEGLGNAETFQHLLDGLNIIRTEEIKLTKIEGIGTYRKITDKNLLNSKKFYIRTEDKVLEIIKKSDYILSFHNLNEDVKIGEDEVYNFSFKIFNQDNNEIRTLETEAFLKISVNNEDIIPNEEDIIINFNEELDIYEGSFNTEIVEEELNGYWENTPVQSVELVITKRGATSNVLRTKEIKVRRE